MSGTRGRALGAAAGGIALAIGFLLGYPAEVGVAVTIAAATLVSLITIRDLARRAEPRTRPVRRAPAGPPLSQLREIDKTLAAARRSGLGDSDLSSLFRPIAAARLALRGVDLDRDEAEARGLLGDRLWELVRAERPRPSQATPEVSSLIEQLEQI